MSVISLNKSIFVRNYKQRYLYFYFSYKLNHSIYKLVLLKKTNAMKINALLTASLFLLLTAIATVSCKSTQEADITPTETSSWTLIQDKILTPSCAVSGCHASDKDKNFSEHGLVLAKEVAYKNLMNVACANQAAKNDGYLRVKPYKAAESLLYHKLNFDVAHHGGKSYGSPMPLGGSPLFVGQLEFVRRWIEAGAPEKGNVVDATILDDKTLSANTDFTPLPAPATGMGFQLKIDKFEVQPNFEREIFVRRMVGNTQEVYINRIQTKSRVNSHHLVIYDFRNSLLLPQLNVVRDLRYTTGALNLNTLSEMSNHIFLGGGTESNTDYTFPEGTAIRLPAGASVDLNPHYFNKTTDKIVYGENNINLYTIDKSKVSKVVEMLDLNNTNISIPAKTRQVFSKSFTFDKDMAVIMLTSHMHRLGEKFVIKIKGGSRDGQVIYETDSWEHPLTKNFTTPILLLKGEGLTSEITYNNTTDKNVRFGLTSEDEMGIIFGYAYPTK